MGLFKSEGQLFNTPSALLVIQRSHPLLIASLFCFYVNCMDGGLSSECVNKEPILEWTLTRLKAKNI
jgi:hypothetical protein